MPCTRNGSASVCPMVRAGFNEEYGSWNTICIRRRNAVSAAPRAASTSTPANVTRPRSGSISRSSARAAVLLPHPLSPTSPNASPAPTRNVTPSTARTVVVTDRGNPRVAVKCLARSRTERMSAPSPASAGEGRGEGVAPPEEPITATTSDRSHPATHPPPCSAPAPASGSPAPGTRSATAHPGCSRTRPASSRPTSPSAATRPTR